MGDVNKLFVFKSLLTMPSNVLPLQRSFALSFYKSKMILDHPNCFGRVHFVLEGSKLQTILVRFKLDFSRLNLNPSKLNYILPKWLGRPNIILDPLLTYLTCNATIFFGEENFSWLPSENCRQLQCSCQNIERN